MRMEGTRHDAMSPVVVYHALLSVYFSNIDIILYFSTSELMGHQALTIILFKTRHACL